MLPMKLAARSGQAERLDLPIIRIPVSKPGDSVLIWTEQGRREERRLFGDAGGGIDPAIFEPALARELIDRSRSQYRQHAIGLV